MTVRALRISWKPELDPPSRIRGRDHVIGSCNGRHTLDSRDAPLVQLLGNFVGDMPPRHESLYHHAMRVCWSDGHLDWGLR